MTVHMQLGGRVLLIGDVHQHDAALATALSWAEERGVDGRLCVGDLADGQGDLWRCCALLGEAGVRVVRGNHDRWALAGQMRELPDAIGQQALAPSRSFLEALPTTLRFDTPLGELLLCHGVGDDDMAQLTADGFGYGLQANAALQAIVADGRTRIVVGGHTHRRMVRTLGGVVFVNPGTLCSQHEPCFAVLDFAARQVDFWDLTGRGPLPAGSVGLATSVDE